MNVITLNQLPINHTGIVYSFHCNGDIRRRFLDLGLIHGTKITPLFISPAGDPTAFSIRGTVIALRKEDSEHIMIKQ